jgi:hypothetical protein
MSIQRALLILVAFISLAFVRGVIERRLHSAREALGWSAITPDELPDALRVERATVAVDLVGPALGLVRPALIGFLALRADALEKEGRLFESAALSRGIVGLLPQLPRMWLYHGERLAWEVSLAAPAEDRLVWIDAAVRLLRDEAPRNRMRDPEIFAGLARIYLWRIPTIFFSARFELEDRWADRFEVAVSAPAERSRLLAERLRAERIDSERWHALGVEASRHHDAAIELDPRFAPSIAIYWAAVGLEAAQVVRPRDPATISRLTELGHLAWREIVARGAIVRAGPESRTAFLPDPRFAGVALAAISADLETYRDLPSVIEDLLDDQAAFVETLVIAHAFWDEETAALAAQRLHPIAAARTADLDAFLERALLSRENPTLDELDAWTSSALRASFWLATRTDDAPGGRSLSRAARGLERLARVIDAAGRSRDPAGVRVGFGDRRAAISKALIDRWRSEPNGRLAAAAERVEDFAGVRAATRVEAPAAMIRGRLVLPYALQRARLDALDPEGDGGSP